MNEFGDIWKSYMKGEPLSKVITESHHAGGDDDKENINEEEYEYVYIDEDGNEIENYQESEEDDVEVTEKSRIPRESEDEEVDEDDPIRDGPGYDPDGNPIDSRDDAEDNPGEGFIKEEEVEIEPEEWEAAEEEDKEESDDSVAQKMATAEAKDKVKGVKDQELHEKLRTLTEENTRLKEDLTFVVRKLRNAGLLED
jgi:hypothetical protein